MDLERRMQDVLEWCDVHVERIVGRRIPPEHQGEMTMVFDYLDKLQKELGTADTDLFKGTNFTHKPYVQTEGVIIAGDNVTLKSFANLRGPVLLGDDVEVGAEIKRSVLQNGAAAGHQGSYIGDSLLGYGVNVGAGTQIANLRFDGKEVPLRDSGGSHLAYMGRKMGAVVGDDVKFGVNSVVAPGTVIPNNSWWIGAKPYISRGD